MTTTDARDREIDALKEELALERKFPERFCMQETIRGQDKAIDRLSAENKRLREAIVPIRKEFELMFIACGAPQDMHDMIANLDAALEGKDHD